MCATLWFESDQINITRIINDAVELKKSLVFFPYTNCRISIFALLNNIYSCINVSFIIIFVQITCSTNSAMFIVNVVHYIMVYSSVNREI